MITFNQFVVWGNANPDDMLDLGDLSAGIQYERTASGRFETLKRLMQCVLPRLDSLLGAPTCDTMSFPDLIDDRQRLLLQIRQRAEWRGGLAMVVDRDLAWLQNAFQVIRDTLSLLTP